MKGCRRASGHAGLCSGPSDGEEVRARPEERPLGFGGAKDVEEELLALGRLPIVAKKRHQPRWTLDGEHRLESEARIRDLQTELVRKVEVRRREIGWMVVRIA